MKVTASICTLLVGSAAAFTSTNNGPRVSLTQTNAAIDDLKAIAEKSNPVLKYYDPLELADLSIWGQGSEASIAFLRHSEIKHGRIAMFAFVGAYCIS